MGKVAKKDYCLVWDTAFNEVENLYELAMGCALSKKMSVVLADPSYRTCSARRQVSFAHDVFYKNDVEKVVSFIRTMKAPGAGGHIFCSGLMFFH